MKKLKKKIYLEVAIKNILILCIFFFMLVPHIMGQLKSMESIHQDATLSMMGFLMGGAIVGAFELSYARTNLESIVQRYLAHTTKFFLYLGISSLMLIALWAMSTTAGVFNDSIFLASVMVYLSLFLHDIWDASCAIESMKGN